MRLIYSCLAAVLLLLLTATCGLASINQFAGSWNNVDPNTDGITKLEIAAMGPGDQGPGGMSPGEAAPGSGPAQIDLTGVWNCDDGGKYYVRQLAATVWWYGERDPNTPNWSNVMRGTISGNTINAQWADVPKGSIMQNGNLVLQIVSNNELVAISKTGGFSGSVWAR
jgi:hypothetical protein